MTNKQKYINVFAETFNLKEEEVEKLEYAATTEWDSVGHMSLIAALEDEFNITMDTDDIIDFSSFERGIEILMQNYKIKF